MRRVRGGSGLGVLVVAVLGVAACGGGSGRTSGGRDGGTLRVVGSSDVEHLDTASAGSVGAYTLNRVYARTLFGTRASNTFSETLPVRADVAARVPSRANGGISADRRIYTVKLRPDVRWNTTPPRAVTAGDFVRGLKRLCNPASPSSGMGYYISTIAGMGGYCQGFAKADSKSAAAIAGYQNRRQIAGLRAVDDRTLVITLTKPAGDFLNIMAMQFAAAAPVEYDAYIPDSLDFRRHTISAGPYQITEYNPGKSYTLTRNPAWRQGSDPLRGRHVAKIQITLGQDSPDTVQQQLEQGTADLSWDQPVPTAAIPRLRQASTAAGKGDSGFSIRDTPSNSPYVVFNTLSPNNGGALGKRAVRQALSYAIDRSAIIKIYGGPAIARPLHTVIPPGSVGHVEYNLYPTPDDSGDPARCKTLLARAGYPQGLKLRLPYRTNSNHQRVAQSIKENLRSCGVDTRLSADTNGDFYGRTIATPEGARAGTWDVAAPGWTPDWYGNNGRTVIQPLFDGRTYGQNSTNYGGYNNPKVNRLIDAALATPSATRAGTLWHQADRTIMQDAAIIPLMSRSFTIYHSKRLKNPLFIPTSTSYDYTNLWLD